MAKTLLSITAAQPTQPEGRRAIINLPASKSISNRLLIMQALSGNEISIDNLSTADDTEILTRALATKSGEIHLGYAGTALRFATAWAAITPGERILTGSERLCKRPLKPLVDSLRKCGADITYLGREGFAPIRIRGKKLRGTTLQIDGSESSQFLTAMLLVAPYFDGATRFTLDPTQVSMPYVKMTLSLMERAGADIQTDGDSITILPGTYTESSFTVEPDWSAASYFYAFALFLPSISILLEGLTAKSIQGDAIIRTLFAPFGIHTEFTKRGARLTSRILPANSSDPSATARLNRVEEPSTIDCLTFPDLAQTLATVACGLNIPLHLTGLQTLRLKETDRIYALATELAKCGTPSTTGPDFIKVEPSGRRAPSDPDPDSATARLHRVAPTSNISTYSDHRMAMAFAPLAAVFGEVVIESPEVVSKSFPNFWQEVKKLGFSLSEYKEE